MINLVKISSSYDSILKSFSIFAFDIFL